MNAIKCFKHADCQATRVCPQCGFLCAKDIKEENTKRHKLLNIDHNIIELYGAISIQEEARKRSTLISLLKESVDALLDRHANATNSRLRQFQAKEKKCLIEIKEIIAQNLTKIIVHTIKMNSQNSPKINKNELKKLNEVVSKFLISKELNEIRDNNYTNQDQFEITFIQKIQTTKRYVKLNSINIQKNQINEQKSPNSKFNQKNKKLETKKQNYFKEELRKSIQMFTESEWDENYYQIEKKYGLKDVKLVCASKLFENNNLEEGKIIIANFNGKGLSDDGAIAIGYAIKKNSVLQTVSLTSDTSTME